MTRLAILPASSAHVERLLQTMKMVKNAQRNILKTTTTLDNPIRFSTEEPSLKILGEEVFLYQHLRYKPAGQQSERKNQHFVQTSVLTHHDQ